MTIAAHNDQPPDFFDDALLIFGMTLAIIAAYYCFPISLQ